MGAGNGAEGPAELAIPKPEVSLRELRDDVDALKRDATYKDTLLKSINAQTGEIAKLHAKFDVTLPRISETYTAIGELAQRMTLLAGEVVKLRDHLFVPPPDETARRPARRSVLVKRRK